MKLRSRSVVALGLTSLLAVGCASQQTAMKPAPTFVVTTPIVELVAGGRVLMYGTGFEPKQEIRLLLKDPGGGLSGINSAVSPDAVANADGAWATAWTYTQYLNSLTPGTGMLSVVDNEYKVLYSAPVHFLPKPKPKPKPEAKPEAKPAP